MELSDACTSFFFLFNYEINIAELNKRISLNALNLLDKKQEIQKLEESRKTKETSIRLTELQAEYEEFIKEILDGALENRAYFADKNYENGEQISVREFQSLFNYNYLNATRLLNDEKTDKIFFQKSNKPCERVNSTVVITNVLSETFMEHFKDYMQLYLFNRERFEKIGASDLHSALSDMKASSTVLSHQVESGLYYRQALADKTTNFKEQLVNPFSEQAEEIIKDPYIFDFIPNAKKLKEIELEDALVQQIKKITIGIWNWFCFYGTTVSNSSW